MLVLSVVVSGRSLVCPYGIFWNVGLFMVSNGRLVFLWFLVEGSSICVVWLKDSVFVVCGSVLVYL